MSNRLYRSRDDVASAILTELQAFTRRLSRRWASAVPDVTFVELMLLRTIAGHESPTVQSVAAELRIDKSTASRQVTALERRGFVGREPIAGERRAQALGLTDQGARAMDDADEVNLRAIVRRLSDWSDDDVEQFATLLRRFNQAPPAD
jgi:DNA-binding MarR family transcriptional regulator